MTTTIVTCPKCGAKNRVDDTRSDVRPVCGKCKTPLDNAAASSSDGHPREVTDATFERELQSAGGRPVLAQVRASRSRPR